MVEYTNAFARSVTDVRPEDGKKRATRVRFRAVAKAKVDGKWVQKSTNLECAKGAGRNAKERTATNIQNTLDAWMNSLNKAEAAKVADNGNTVPGADTTVAKYVEAYIDTLETAGSVRPSAISDYRTSSNRIAEGIGDVILRDLKPAMIQAWEGDLLKSGKGVNTVLKFHRLLNSVCKHAVAVHDIDWNPCTAVKKPKRVAPSPNSLTAEQHARLAATLAAMGPTPVVVAATIAAYTGMREGEVCGLTWDNYDRDAGIIHVRKAIAKAGGKKYITTPKTEASRRDVPVHPDLASMLDRRREAMVAALGEAKMELSPTEFGKLYVCGTIDGKFLDTTILSRSWKQLAEAFELVGTQGRNVTFHDLRHSFATRAIASGADVKAVASVLGHTDARLTLNVYADADKEAKRRAVALMGASIAAQGDAKPFEVVAR